MVPARSRKECPDCSSAHEKSTDCHDGNVHDTLGTGAEGSLVILEQTGGKAEIESKLSSALPLDVLTGRIMQMRKDEKLPRKAMTRSKPGRRMAVAVQPRVMTERLTIRQNPLRDSADSSTASKNGETGDFGVGSKPLSSLR